MTSLSTFEPAGMRHLRRATDWRLILLCGGVLTAMPLGLRACESEACACIELERVIITARPSERPLTIVTDPRAPAQPIPAQDGAEALRGIAGMTVIRKGGTDGDPVLRGMAGSRLGVLLDGEQILGGCGNRMDPPTAYVFPSSYDRITVLKGPQSVLHGPGNSAGVVLFERTNPRYSVPAAGMTGALTLGSFGRNDQFLELRAGRPQVYAEAGLTRTASDDYEDGDNRKIASAYERWSARAAVGWTPEPGAFLELSTLASDGEAAYADRGMDGSKFARRNLSLRARRELRTGAIERVEANVFVNAVDHVMDNFSLRPFTPTMMMPGHAASNPDRLTLGARGVARFAPACACHWTFTAGADYQENRHRVRSTSDNRGDPYAAKPRIRDAEFAAFGLFVEATRALSEASRVVTGARVDAWSAKDHRAGVATGMMAGLTSNPTAGLTRRAELPSAFARYEHDLRSGLSLFAGVGHARRFPDYWELFSKESATTVSAFGTRPERTTQFDTGLTYRSHRLQTSLSLFANRVDDFILIQTAFAKPSGMMGMRSATIARNIGAESLGGEASLSWEFAEGWRLDTAVSVVRGENRSESRPLAQQPPLEARVGLNYATSVWSIGSLVRMAGRQSRFALNEGNIAGQDLGPSVGFAALSFNAAWKPGARWQVSVGMDNVLDHSYAEHLSRGGTLIAGFPAPTMRINEPGRTGWTRLDVKW